MKFHYIFLFLLFSIQNSFSQLSDFDLSVTSVNETCTANGALSWSVSNTTAGATILYTIFKLPNLATPISVQSTTSLSGLSAGVYRVVATQSLNNQSGTQQREVPILNQITPLAYALDSNNEVCGFDGTITVEVSSGTANQYEIISGPLTKPLQTSNIFTGLTAGTYLIRVFDNCGVGVVQSYTLFSSNPELEFDLITPSMSSCTSIETGFSVSPSNINGVISYPLTVVITVNPPVGSPIITTQTLNEGEEFTTEIPYYAQQPYTFSFSMTDSCGASYTQNGTINNVSPQASYSVITESCTEKSIKFSNVISLILTSAPSEYPNSLPQNFTSQILQNQVTITDLTAGTYIFNAINFCGLPQQFTIIIDEENQQEPYSLLFNRTCQTASVLIFEIAELILTSAPSSYNVTLPFNYTSLINNANYAAFVDLPIGTYVFDVKDTCGQPDTLTVVIEPLSLPPVISVLEGCNDGVGSLKVSGQMQTVTLIAAPSSFTTVSIPHDYTSSLLDSGNALVLDLLPPGEYTFETSDSCGITYIKSAVVLGYSDTTSVTVVANCGSFNLQLNHSSTNNGTYWLQKWFPLLSTWGHPFTGVAYAEGSVPNNSNSYSIPNNALIFNLATMGDFRVVKNYQSFTASALLPAQCVRVIDEFQFKNEPDIIAIYAVSCNNTFEVVVEAVGLGPLQYSIIKKNNEPFVISNLESNFFSGLVPALYTFQVEDVCGNILTSDFEVVNPNPLLITIDSVFCPNENITLSVPNFDFLVYRWWKDGNTADTLSTSNALTFNSFNAQQDNGTYSLEITYPGNPNSCLNQVLTYTINVTVELPEAGEDYSTSFCGRPGFVNLYSLLQNEADTNGNWIEISSNTPLEAGVWDTTLVDYGTYFFRYRVEGVCNLFDEAQISITIKPIPDPAIVSLLEKVCENGSIALFAETTGSVSYNWTGPNGFTSSLQNPMLNTVSSVNNGLYEVIVTLEDCPSSPSSIMVEVNSLPQFTLTQRCAEMAYLLEYQVVDNSFSSSEVDHYWFGPDGFNSTTEMVAITQGKPGQYGLTITDDNGCSTTQFIDVPRTICFIPNVITPNNDGTNDSFDLTGFGVKRLEIFNRWGRTVYEKENYEKQWQGQNNKGEELPDGTYYYLIEDTTDEPQKTGWIFISRG